MSIELPVPSATVPSIVNVLLATFNVPNTSIRLEARMLNRRRRVTFAGLGLHGEDELGRAGVDAELVRAGENALNARRVNELDVGDHGVDRPPTNTSARVTARRGSSMPALALGGLLATLKNAAPVIAVVDV